MKEPLKTLDELAENEELCIYCPIPCEGSRCHDAYQNYLEEYEEEL